MKDVDKNVLVMNTEIEDIKLSLSGKPMQPIYLSAKLEVTALQQRLQDLANDQYVLFHAADFLEKAM